MNKKAIVGLLLLSLTSQAQVQVVNVQKDIPAKKPVDLYKVMTSKEAQHLKPLSQLKDHEIHLRWSDCASLAPSVFSTQKGLRGWVGLTWLHCLNKAQKKKKDFAAVDRALATILGNKELFQNGPWSRDLAKSWLSLKMDQLAEAATGKNLRVSTIEEVLKAPVELAREENAKLYQYLGDLALQKPDLNEAEFLFLQSKFYQDTSYTQDRLDYIARAKKLAPKVKAETVVSAVTLPEEKLEERVRQALKDGDAIAAMKDAVSLLNQYPGSKVSKRLKDKPLEIYNTLSENVQKTKALSEMTEADSNRLMDWAQNLHRRGDYLGSLALAAKVLERTPSSTHATSALWITGRSAHFVGQYDLALEQFNKLILFHNGSEESAEAAFRSGLIFYRKKEFSAASSIFEKLLLQNRDKYDLNVRYWLVRSLQAVKSERAAGVAAGLIEEYPFSYYGLRLKAEANSGKVSWPVVKEKLSPGAEKFYLVGEQKESWKRFLALSEAGWMAEAHAEIPQLPFIKDATLKIKLAEKMAQRMQFFTAIRWTNDALDADPLLRQEQFLKIGYPEVFVDLYKEASERYGIDPSLLRSLTRQESGFNLQAVSTSNALGLMQMIPPTAADVAKKLGLRIEIPEDMFRPEINIPMGSNYVSQMLVQFEGNVPFALAAYNAGPHRLKNWFEGRVEVSELVSRASSEPQDELWFDELPWTETSFYVKAILRNVLLYRLVEGGEFSLKPVLWQDLLYKKAK